MQLRQVRVLISGRVQGVGFRASTVKQVSRYPSLNGWVRNLPDGRVEAIFSGPADEVEAMLEWSKHGPRSAQVTDIQWQEEKIDSSLTGFKLTRLLNG